MKAASWRRTASGKDKHEAIPLPARQPAIDQHGLILIGFAAAKSIQTGKSAGIADGRITGGINYFRRKNRSHSGHHCRIAAGSLSSYVCARRERTTRARLRLHLFRDGL